MDHIYIILCYTLNILNKGWMKVHLNFQDVAKEKLKITSVAIYKGAGWPLVHKATSPTNFHTVPSLMQ